MNAIFHHSTCLAHTQICVHTIQIDFREVHLIELFKNVPCPIPSALVATYAETVFRMVPANNCMHI